mmetsp:Transcript_76669/g.197457  ORF Transcript_76669/g.197457 Transcript_76669/m.197457 type:complete len:314 (+) Transcript_76669:385-1326(+)
MLRGDLPWLRVPPERGFGFAARAGSPSHGHGRDELPLLPVFSVLDESGWKEIPFQPLGDQRVQSFLVVAPVRRRCPGRHVAACAGRGRRCSRRRGCWRCRCKLCRRGPCRGPWGPPPAACGLAHLLAEPQGVGIVAHPYLDDVLGQVLHLLIHDELRAIGPLALRAGVVRPVVVIVVRRMAPHADKVGVAAAGFFCRGDSFALHARPEGCVVVGLRHRVDLTEGRPTRDDDPSLSGAIPEVCHIEAVAQRVRCRGRRVNALSEPTLRLLHVASESGLHDGLGYLLRGAPVEHGCRPDIGTALFPFTVVIDVAP